MNLIAPIVRFLPRFRYRLATVFAITTLIAVPLAIRAQREHEYRLRLAALAVLLQDEGDYVCVEDAGGGPESRNHLYALSGRTLRRDEVVVEARCDSSDEDISAVLCLPTLLKLSLRDVPTGRFEDPRIEFPPGTSEKDKREVLLYAGKVPMPPPIGAIDAAIRRIAKLPSLDEVDLSSTSVSDEGVRDLTHIKRLRALNLAGTHITDAAVKHLGSINRMEELNFASTGISDEGLRCLSGLCSLRVFKISHTKITGAGFEDLSRLRALETLDLSETPFTDDGVRHLAALGRLRKLNLNHTKISAGALSHISSMQELSELSLWADDIGNSLAQLGCLPRLQRLSMRATRLSDAALEDLVRSESLLELDLIECYGISDAGIAQLSRIPSLREVSLNDASVVTPAGVAELERLRPDLQIGWVSFAGRE